MKRLILLIPLLVALSASAQQHYSKSFFGPTVVSLQVSNTSFGITNLMSTVLHAVPLNATNTWGTLWTNVSPFWYQNTNLFPGYRNIIVKTNITIAGSLTNATAYGNNVQGPLTSYCIARERDTTALLGEGIDLFPPKGDVPITPAVVGTIVTNVANASVSIRLVGVNAAANSAVNFRFIAVPDGKNELTTSGGDWTVAVTANGTTPVCVSEPVPLWKFVGCKKIRLQSIENTDETANSAVWVTDITYNGFTQ